MSLRQGCGAPSQHGSMYKHTGQRLCACSGYICVPQSGQGMSMRPACRDNCGDLGRRAVRPQPGFESPACGSGAEASAETPCRPARDSVAGGVRHGGGL